MSDPATRVDERAAEVGPVDEEAHRAALGRWDTLAKPPGSLGTLEVIGARLAAISGSCPPPIPGRPSLLVIAADHGVHAQGVTPWPQSITTAMVEVIADGQAACNAIARTVGAAVTVLDVGCAAPPRSSPGLRSIRIRPGTADLSRGPAMTRDEAARAILAGADVTEELIASGTDLLVLGDMGLANTTASAALIAAVCDRAAEEVTGPGAGADDAAVQRKVDIVAGAVSRIPSAAGPLDVLAEVGGLEHAGLVGAMLAAAAARVPVVLDGVITDAAALLAQLFARDVTGYLFAGHRSTEPGARVALEALNLPPVLQLDLRLGEGTGGLLAMPIIRAAAAALSDTAAISDLA